MKNLTPYLVKVYSSRGQLSTAVLGKNFAVILAKVMSVEFNEEKKLLPHNITALRLAIRSRQAFARIFSGCTAEKWKAVTTLLMFIDRETVLGHGEFTMEIQAVVDEDFELDFA